MKLTLTKNYIPELYWTPQKANSYNLTFRYCMSNRSDGKTTNGLIDAIHTYNKYETQFVYSRRTKNETKMCASILDNLIAEQVTFVGDGLGGGKFVVKKQVIGYLIPFGMQNKYKSRDFEHVGIIIFDEITLDRRNHLQRYLPTEMDDINNLISTVFRNRDNYKVWFFGNNLDYINPFFQYYNIPQLETGQIYVDKERELFVEIIKTKDKLQEIKENTPVAKLNKNTQFNNFLLNNEILTSILYKIREKRNADKLVIRLLYDSVTFNIYISYTIYIYIEMQNKIIEDDYSVLIRQNGIVHYLNIKGLKAQYDVLMTMLLKAYYSNKFIEYNSKNCGAVFSDLIERYLK